MPLPHARRLLGVGALALAVLVVLAPSFFRTPVALARQPVVRRGAHDTHRPAASASVRRAAKPSDGQQAARYAYGVETPLELPSPPPPSPAPSATSTRLKKRTTPRCKAHPWYTRFLHARKWAAADMLAAKGALGGAAGAEAERRRSAERTSNADAGYVCYQHRHVEDDPRLGRKTCRAPFNARRCPVRRPTFGASAGGCLCCPMAGHACPPCWGCLMPLARRRAFAAKLYERETGGTANVFFASEVRRQGLDHAAVPPTHVHRDPARPVHGPPNTTVDRDRAVPFRTRC
jgi:hypothetical protein